MKLLIAPRYNMRGKKDATGAFQPEAHAFSKAHGGNTLVRLFDNTVTMADRFIEVTRWIESFTPGTSVRLGALVLLACACMPTVSTHAHLAERLYAPLVDAKGQIEASAYNDAARVRVAACSASAGESAVEELRVRYELVEGTLAAAVSAYNGYVDAIRGARDGGDDAQAEAARVLLLHWTKLRHAAASLGVVVRPAPLELVEFGR